MKTTSALARWWRFNHPFTVRFGIRSASVKGNFQTEAPRGKKSRSDSKNVATVSIFCHGVSKGANRVEIRSRVVLYRTINTN